MNKFSITYLALALMLSFPMKGFSGGAEGHGGGENARVLIWTNAERLEQFFEHPTKDSSLNSVLEEYPILVGQRLEILHQLKELSLDELVRTHSSSIHTEVEAMELLLNLLLDNLDIPYSKKVQLVEDLTLLILFNNGIIPTTWA